MNQQSKQTLEGAGTDDRLHQEILAEGGDRFPEESFQQLLSVGVTPEEALEMLGYHLPSGSSSQESFETPEQRQNLKKDHAS